jgi:hypothetical protein
MRLLPIFLLAGLSACATAPVDHWADLTTDTDPATTPLDCGKFPLPSAVVDGDLVYDNDGANRLEAYRACSEANEGIAAEHVMQIAELKIVRKELTAAGRAQQSIADLRLEALTDERQHNFWTSIGYWVVIIGMGFAL